MGAEFDEKFNIPDPVPVKRRTWTCRSEACVNNELAYDEMTGTLYEYDEDIKVCPLCGSPQTIDDPAPEGNRLVTMLHPTRGVVWCCFNGQVCAAQPNGYMNPMTARHCDLCGE